MTRVVLYLGYLAAATLLLLELSLRWFLPQPLPQRTPDIYRPDPEIGWRRSGNVHVSVNTGERDVEFCTDARGDRVECGDPRHGSCSVRVLVLGDSFVEALAIPYGETAWSRLERETNACFFVAGVGGYGPQQYARQAQERLRNGERFDLVVVNFFVGNDFTISADRMPDAEEVALPELRLLPAGLSTTDLFEWLYPFNEWLEARSHAFVGGRSALRALLGYDDVRRYGIAPALRRSGLSETLVGETLKALGRIADETRASRVPLLFVVIPLSNQVLDPNAEALRARFPEMADDLDMGAVAERFVPRLSELSGARVVDLLPYLRAHADAGTWGRRDPHFSPGGHALWFDAIRTPVAEILNGAHEPARSGGPPRREGG